MKRILECGACVLVAVLTTLGVTTWVNASASPAGPPPRGGEVQSAAALDTAIESKFTPITPCRIVDTRAAGGALANGTSRGFVAAKTTGFEAQGGKAGGCDIPAAATAIQVAMTAATPTGNGFLRVSPGNVSSSSATFMNFTRTFNVSNGGVIPITPASPAHFRVYGNLATTHVVIDVQGYYVKPITAGVTLDGVLVQGTRGTAATRTSTGHYTVTFDRNVNVCSTVVTAFDANATASIQTTSANQAFIITSLGGVVTDKPFYVVVTC